MPVKLSDEEKAERKRCNQINSMMHRAWSRDPERFAVLNANTRPYKGTDKRIKREHQCALCKKWFINSKIGRKSTMQIDHIVAVGSFKYLSQIGEFAARLFCSRTGLQKLCLWCHQIKTVVDNKKTRGES